MFVSHFHAHKKAHPSWEVSKGRQMKWIYDCEKLSFFLSFSFLHSFNVHKKKIYVYVKGQKVSPERTKMRKRKRKGANEKKMNHHRQGVYKEIIRR